MIAVARTAKSSKQSAPKPARRAWEPGAKDHLVYQWVKFDGKTQLCVAAELGISQATVSRIIDRYDRWQAHADPREGGRLDAAERLRAQRWLTYERNELILASALRIAAKMEGVTESHKSVRTKPQSEWFQEGTEIRTEETSVDRHGIAARFLRLAFRINMDQLKLVQQDAPPLPGPLTEEELADEERWDAAIAEDLDAAQRRSEESMERLLREHDESLAQAEELQGLDEEARATASAPSEPVDPSARDPRIAQGTSETGDNELDVESEPAVERDEAAATPAVMQALHKLHHAADENSAATSAAACTCTADAACGKNADEACIGTTAQTRESESLRFDAGLLTLP